MNTKIIRLKYLITAILICLISGNVWGEELSQINLQTDLSFSDFNKAGTSYITTSKSVTFPANDGNFYSSWSIKSCMVNSSGTRKVLQMKSGSGQITSPSILSNNGFTIIVTYSSKQALSVSINNDKVSGTKASSANANGTGCEVSLTTTSTNCTFVLDAGSAVTYVSKIELIPTSSSSSVTAPTISPETGNFENSQEVTITPAEGTTVYYTTDGNDPDNASTLYKDPFTITKTTTVKAIAYKDAETSDIVSATYTKVLPTPTFKFSSDNISINLGETFTAPKLDNTSDGIVTYKSSNTDLAIIDDKGTVTLVEGASGTTTITASVTETETWAAASASYTLNVIDPNAPINLVLNGSFEEGLTNWGNDDKSSFIQVENSHTGTHAAANTGNTQARLVQVISGLAIGQKYTFSFWYTNYAAKNDNGLKNYSLSDPNDAKTLIDGSTPQKLAAASNWIKYEKVFVAKTTSFKINIRAYEACTIDDIELVPYQEPSSSTTDPTTKSMTLTGAWTAEGLAALDLTGINSLDMTGISVPTGVTLSDTRNPNCLVYVSDKDAANLGALPNVIAISETGNSAQSTIQLTDGHDFHNKIAFSGTISYTRTFETGWNTFALPFPATIEAGDEVEEFDSMKDGKTIQFKKATTIAANTPYLINIAAAGEKTFTANGDVPVTASTGDIYKSCFTKLAGDDMNGKYILVLEGDKEVFAPATTGATLPAFRGYLELPQVTGIRYSIAHDQGGATNIETSNGESANIYTENGILNIHTNVAQAIQIRSIDGRTIQSVQLAENADIQINNLAKGIYLVNNRKVIIK